MRRDTFTARPSPGDYVLSRTGVTWNLDRATGHESVMRVLAGQSSLRVALSSLRSHAHHDKVDAWETDGPLSYRLILRTRRAS